MKNFNLAIFTLVCIILSLSKVKGQEESKLELTKKNGVIFTIPVNKKIKVIWVDNLRGVHINKGKLEIINPNTIKIQEQLIPVEQITKIKMHTIGSKTLSAKLGAAAMVGVGLGIGMNSSSGRAMNSNGVLVASLGVGCALISIPTFIIPKTFNLETKYELKVVLLDHKNLIVSNQ